MAKGTVNTGIRPALLETVTSVRRLIITLIVGVLAAGATYLSLQSWSAASGYDRLGHDFTIIWRAGHALLDGLNPYDVLRPAPGARSPFTHTFAYPLPAGFVGIPFTPLRPVIAAAVFVGLSFALAAYGLLRDGVWRLLVLMSAPAFTTLSNGQAAPLLLAAALLPPFGWLLIWKPTVGAAYFLAWPNRWTLVGGAVAAVLAFAVLPTWPFDWIETVLAFPQLGQYRPPVRMFGGAFLVLAWLRWRRPEARLLGTLALVPQNTFFYEQLPLMLIPQSPRALLLFVLWSNVLKLSAEVLRPRAGIPNPVSSVLWEPVIVLGLYLPALVMVLRRPNVGPLPAWLDRQLVRRKVPRWLRGAPEAA